MPAEVPRDDAPGSVRPADDRSGTRKLVVWMHSPEFPGWHMPAGCEERVREALGEGWRLARLEVPVDGTGDGPEAAPEPLLEEIRDAEVYCGFGLPRAAFRAARRLRWVHSGAAGVGSTLYPEMRESEVLLTNSAGAYAEPTAEHALAMILHFARSFDEAAAGARNREWRQARIKRGDARPHEVAGTRVGVVGYGSTGRALGRRAAALGMEVWGLRRRPGPEPPPEAERILGPDGLGELLGGCEWVVLCLPETSETRGLIGPDELKAMRPGSVLVNVARGSVVDEEALARALREGPLRGAGLDAFREEPLPPSSPLWALDNVLITPHVAGESPRYWERETDLIVENVNRYLDGRPLRNVVDKELGY